MKPAMDVHDYENAVNRTAQMDFHNTRMFLMGHDDHLKLLLGAMGLAGEAGEFADMVKKIVFHGKAVDVDALKLELGDVLWYLTLAADALGADLPEIMALNNEKLRKRYPDGFTEAAANAPRDTDENSTVAAE